MSPKGEDSQRVNEKHDVGVQIDRIRIILDGTIEKLRLMNYIPLLMENDGYILYQHLSPTDANFIMSVSRAPINALVSVDDQLELVPIVDPINNTNKERLESCNRRKSVLYSNHHDDYMSYIIDTIFGCPSLVEWMRNQPDNFDPNTAGFLEAITTIREVSDAHLAQTATEELERENELKSAYRTSIVLTKNIKELEGQLHKQRDELEAELDRKTAILNGLVKRIAELKATTSKDINQIVFESETTMMKDFNKNIELQEQLSIDAKEAVQHFNTLQWQNLNDEKALRAKRFKVESQLTSWLHKYDQDIGEKHAEFEALEKQYNDKKEIVDMLREQMDDEEDEYLALMAEREEEEMRIFAEKAIIFLRNRSARRIQICWREYWQRKLLRKKGKKSKKKGDGKPKEPYKRKKDANELVKSALQGDFKKDDEAFAKKDIVVDLQK